VEDLDSDDRRADDVALEARPDDLDLRQLGHDASGYSAPTAVSSR
jgi:hypothetical protein